MGALRRPLRPAGGVRGLLVHVVAVEAIGMVERKRRREPAGHSKNRAARRPAWAPRLFRPGPGRLDRDRAARGLPGTWALANPQAAGRRAGLVGELLLRRARVSAARGHRRASSGRREVRSGPRREDAGGISLRAGKRDGRGRLGLHRARGGLPPRGFPRGRSALAQTADHAPPAPTGAARLRLRLIRGGPAPPSYSLSRSSGGASLSVFLKS